ncbi:hypothetical protein TNCV_2491701 [Trichonephila clavipes]|nr:hypothetical protein TNCV_2491701 [Trichonephila clavipes]
MSTKLVWELNTGGFAPPDRNICSCTSGPKVTYNEMGADGGAAQMNHEPLFETNDNLREQCLENTTGEVEYLVLIEHHEIPRGADKDGEPLARGTIFWALQRSKRSTATNSSIKEFSVRFFQFKELSEKLKFIMYPDVTWFDKMILPQFDWLEIEGFEMQLFDF